MLKKPPKKYLYEELVQKFKGRDSNKIVYELNEFANAYWDIYEMNSVVIYSFFYLTHDFWKIVLIAAKYFNYPHFEILCTELRKFYYSYWIGNHISTKVRNFSYKLIEWIGNGEEISFIKRKINEKMNDDDILNWVLDQITGDVYNKRWLKPVLVLLEYNLTDHSKQIYIDIQNEIHVDHILPIGWQSITEWKKDWDKKNAKEWINTIGNLTLLSQKKNIRASNHSFQKKKAIYEGKSGDRLTSFELSKNIVLKEKWTENELKNRYNTLILQLINLLELNSNDLIGLMNNKQRKESKEYVEFEISPQLIIFSEYKTNVVNSKSEKSSKYFLEYLIHVCINFIIILFPCIVSIWNLLISIAGD